jgi:hypothetical protein
MNHACLQEWYDKQLAKIPGNWHSIEQPQFEVAHVWTPQLEVEDA